MLSVVENPKKEPVVKRSFVLLALAAASAFAADRVSGTWKFEGSVSGYPLNQTCTFKQDGTKLTGSCKGEGEPAELAGEVTGEKITFKHGGDYQGTALTVTYNGTLGADGVIKGTIDVAPFDASGDFTAKKGE